MNKNKKFQETKEKFQQSELSQANQIDKKNSSSFYRSIVKKFSANKTEQEIKSSSKQNLQEVDQQETSQAEAALIIPISNSKEVKNSKLDNKSEEARKVQKKALIEINKDTKLVKSDYKTNDARTNKNLLDNAVDIEKSITSKPYVADNTAAKKNIIKDNSKEAKYIKSDTKVNEPKTAKKKSDDSNKKASRLRSLSKQFTNLKFGSKKNLNSLSNESIANDIEPSKPKVNT